MFLADLLQVKGPELYGLEEGSHHAAPLPGLQLTQLLYLDFTVEHSSPGALPLPEGKGPLRARTT